jgi:hypothetical protein
MSVELSSLETEWLHAETLADKARYEAEAVEARQKMARDEIEVRILASNAELARARQEKADKMAAAAFEKLWSARDHASTSYSAVA